MDRLRKKKDFQKIFSSGRKIISSHTILYALPNDLENIRVGLAVSKRIGNAVVRNRIKRRLREAMRQALCLVLKEKESSKIHGYDIVLIPRQRCVTAKSSEIVTDLTEKLKNRLK